MEQALTFGEGGFELSTSTASRLLWSESPIPKLGITNPSVSELSITNIKTINYLDEVNNRTKFIPYVLPAYNTQQGCSQKIVSAGAYSAYDTDHEYSLTDWTNI